MNVTEQAIRDIFNYSLDRVLKNEDMDPCMAMCVALLNKEEVTQEEMLVILDAHEHGPWRIRTPAHLKIFAKWCSKAGVELKMGTPEVLDHGIHLYRDNEGDCVLAESSRRRCYAMWTKKGRLYIGFNHEVPAKDFRNSDPEFSMESTGNKWPAFVVIEGGDNPDMVAKAINVLKDF